MSQEIFCFVDLNLEFRGHCSFISRLPGESDIEQFKDFLLVDDAKTKATAEDYCRWMRRFFRRFDSVSIEVIRSYLKDLKENFSVHYYCSNLSALKAYFDRFKGYPQLVAGFKFPRKPLKMKEIPPREDLQRFYGALPSLRTEAYFLVTASSGLRRGEVLSLAVERGIDFDKRMLTPTNHIGSTKHK